MQDQVLVAWQGKHFGEEPPLVGNSQQGAGTIFFTGCNLHCLFCQNYQISQQRVGRKYSIKQLAEIMLDLQNEGAINIDLVSPTIWWQQIKQAIVMARQQGLHLPIVWNSNGQESVLLLKQMKGYVDIYLPDFKYADDQLAEQLSGSAHYQSLAVGAITEMIKQVGVAQADQDIISTGVLVRHLIIPSQAVNSKKVLKIIHDQWPNVPVSLMSQYYPCYQANTIPEINRLVSRLEYQEVLDYYYQLSLSGFVQEYGNSKFYLPDFTQTNPFQ